MSVTPRNRSAFARCSSLWLLLAYATTGCGGEPVGIGPTSVSPVTVPTGPIFPGPVLASPVLLAAGDIGQCGGLGAMETGRLLDRLSGTVIAPGDLAYPVGSAQDFADCYDPFWGRHRSRTRPAPGNHEYYSPGARPYFDYFGSQAGPSGLGYYSFRTTDWLVLSLNSNVPSGINSAQGHWLRAELTAYPSRCTLAYFHYPLVSSGPNGDNPQMAGLWQILHEHGVDVVVNGHDHMYERFAPMTPDAQRDALGIRQFIVGTGGVGLSQVRRLHPNSEVQVKAHGLLMLTLSPTGYQWEFLDVTGGRRDAGIGTCH